jgi:hypothetical protein
MNFIVVIFAVIKIEIFPSEIYLGILISLIWSVNTQSLGCSKQSYKNPRPPHPVDKRISSLTLSTSIPNFPATSLLRILPSSLHLLRISPSTTVLPPSDAGASLSILYAFGFKPQ